ncbi:MAG: sulfurtransferase TusA family protein [Spirochaetaceae bacterium]|jgi:TusA-related sulfurtransferase|nr:sulfurtransferase TusA family protein [Spirochaetaceae bacterium]
MSEKRIDITDVVCPTTFVKIKVALDDLEDGEILEVRLNDGEPLQNAPQSLKNEGHKITKIEQNPDSTWLITVVKGGLESRG